MSRSRKADHDTAIAAAQGLFWRHGYSGTSTRQIEQETGLTRFTLQTAYGGKEGFFLDTLDAYLDRFEAEFLPDAEICDLDGLACWFERRGRPGEMACIGESGCLLLNSIEELDSRAQQVSGRVERYFTGLHRCFAGVLRRAQERGEARDELDPDASARVLASLLMGLQTAIKSRTDDEFPASYVQAAGDLIRSWKAQG